MGADPFFHCTESMRMARRDGSVAVFSTDSVTSPDRMASLGITVPFNNVATTSLASTLVPTGVLPAATFCRITAGDSSPVGELWAVGVGWATKATDPRTTVKTAIVLLSIWSPPAVTDLDRGFGLRKNYTSRSY